MYRIINFLKLLFGFRIARRLNRIQYLKAQLLAFLPVMAFIMIVILFVVAANVNFNDAGIMRVIYFLFDILVMLFWILNSLSASIARLHDCNRSGWWILLINLLSFLILPIFLLCIWPGTDGRNKYGNPSRKIWTLING